MRLALMIAMVALATMSVFAQNPENTVKLPEVKCDSVAEGFCDIALAIRQKSAAEDGTLLLTAAGTRKNQRLELRVAIAPEMKRGDMNPVTGAPQTYSLQRGGVRFERTGEASDRLVGRLAELYQTKFRPVMMDNDIHFTAFAFRGDPEKITVQDVLFELYHEDPSNQVPQCELLLDVNLPANEVRIREKNQDFRECVVRILGVVSK